LSKRHAIVSIGTNSTRLLLADVASENPRIELVRSMGTRLGEGLGDRGHLGDEPMARTLDAVEQYVRTARGHYVRLFAVATSALRRADNGEEFAARVAALLGVPLRVLSGEEEAAACGRSRSRRRQHGICGRRFFAAGYRRLVRNRRGAIDGGRAGAGGPRRSG
jgi:exopolyphosphatase/pppGpp-phosphohydrolase